MPKGAPIKPRVVRLPEDEGALNYFRMQCMVDTGFLCRNLLGWDYDEDDHGRAVNPGSGGIRPDGAHGEMVSFIDNPDHHFQVIEAPRGSYKSTVAQGFVTRQIILDPNVRILYGMKTAARAKQKAIAIRNCLKLKTVEAIFGAQIGDEQWEQTEFTVAQRSQTNLQEPTFSTFSLESMPTGGHYNFIIVDDLIDRENCKTPEALENAKSVAGLLFPLLTNGGYLIFIGTRYADNDIYHELENKTIYSKFIRGAGVRVVREQGQGLSLALEPGGLTFPHLTLKKLNDALINMSRGGSYFDFSCQYLNVVPTGIGTAFTRQMFRPLAWSPSQMRWFSGYLLTDTATSLKEEGCYSVVAYILVDEADNLYLADCRVGHWRPREFVDQFFDVLVKWTGIVNHVGECWETISLVTVFRDMIDQDARGRKHRLNTIQIPRTSADHKFSRIDKLELPMLRNKFFVLDTVPRVFADLDGQKVLFDREGYRDPRSGAVLPGGELVDEFVRLRAHPKQDIADAIAMAVENDRDTGKRFCSYRKRGVPIKSPDWTVLTPGIANAHIPRERTEPDQVSWWDKTVRQLHDR